MKRVATNKRKRNRSVAVKAAVLSSAWALKRRILWLVIPAVLGGAGYGLYWGYWCLHTTSYFRITRIEVTGCRRSAPQEIILLSGVKKGESIFDKDLGAVADNIYKHPWVATVRVSRKLPGEVRIAVAEREPAILIAMGGVYMVDQEGEVFKRVVPGDDVRMPVITGIGRDDYVAHGEQTRAQVRSAIALHTEFARQNVGKDISEIHIDPMNGFTVFTSDRAMEIRFGRGRFAERVSALRDVLAGAARRGVNPAAIYLDNDFRTDLVALKVQ